jgi:hypothetical protein
LPMQLLSGSALPWDTVLPRQTTPRGSALFAAFADAFGVKEICGRPVVTDGFLWGGLLPPYPNTIRAFSVSGRGLATSAQRCLRCPVSSRRSGASERCRPLRCRDDYINVQRAGHRLKCRTWSAALVVIARGGNGCHAGASVRVVCLSMVR